MSVVVSSRVVSWPLWRLGRAGRVAAGRGSAAVAPRMLVRRLVALSGLRASAGDRRVCREACGVLGRSVGSGYPAGTHTDHNTGGLTP